MDFPKDRKDFKPKKTTAKSEKSPKPVKISMANNAELDELEFETTFRVIEETKEYVWVRAYLTSDSAYVDSMIQGDVVSLTYKPTGEKLNMDFYFYDKKAASSVEHDDGTIQHFEEEDDKSVLILCVEVGALRKNSAQIPTLRKFFKESGFYENTYIPMSELVLNYESDNGAKPFDNVLRLKF